MLHPLPVDKGKIMMTPIILCLLATLLVTEAKNAENLHQKRKGRMYLQEVRGSGERWALFWFLSRAQISFLNADPDVRNLRKLKKFPIPYQR